MDALGDIACERVEGNEVVALWTHLNDSFDPRLSERIDGDFGEYVRKLAARAETLACFDADSPDHLPFGAGDGGAAGARVPLGAISYYANDTETRCAYVTQLAVAPAAQRGGVASALVRAMLADCAAKGMRTVRLEVWADRPAALGLYAKFGFTACEQDGGQYVLERTLPAASPAPEA